MEYPSISILIPTLGREEGLKICLDSIKKLEYPVDKIDVWVKEDEPRLGVPKRIKQGVEETKDEYICFASNDIEFDPRSILCAIKASQKYNKALVSFNTGIVYPDKGNICEHFILKRDIIRELDNGEVFCTEFNHVGVDNYLWAQCEKMNQAMRCDEAVVIHRHFSKGYEFDSTYQLGWSNVENDRNILKIKLEKLYGKKETSKKVIS